MQIKPLRQIVCLSIALVSGVASGELVQMDSEELENTSAQSGITIDLDFGDPDGAGPETGVEFSYSYQNDANPNEDHWVVGLGTSGEVVQINGLTLDVVSGAQSGIAIGLPSEVILKNVNTGDYFVADAGVDPNSPPKADEINKTNGGSNLIADRKLFGLRWNTAVLFDFTSPLANATENYYDNLNVSNLPKFYGHGSVIIAGD